MYENIYAPLLSEELPAATLYQYIAIGRKLNHGKIAIKIVFSLKLNEYVIWRDENYILRWNKFIITI